ncbi:hypothetical protein [Polyangium jinanense]|uniref:Uncharacterized protein n=1 Tax=Polyangium jinanense TaxID=2829994 RepID=A0A9X3XFD7_9BACT|nr:hypothetical protein [Polyangium jinanense]MDC3959215.1 hypothetical protein [Polyangium jinanense]MDC3987693.1 hypothetical protein [Polyangium jinanense]
MTPARLTLLSLVGATFTAVSVYVLTPPRAASMEALRMGLGVSVIGLPAAPFELRPEAEEVTPELAPSVEPVVRPVPEPVIVPAATQPPPVVKPEATPASKSPPPPSAPPTSTPPSAVEPIRFVITGPNGLVIQGNIPVPTGPIVLPPLPTIVAPVLTPSPGPR